MKKLILLALAPLMLTAIPAGAQTRVEQRVVERPDGTVTRTVTRGDGYGDRRTVVRTERRDGDRSVVRTVRRDGDRTVVRTRGRGWEGRRGWRDRRGMRRCWTTWRHHRRVTTCAVRRGRY